MFRHLGLAIEPAANFTIEIEGATEKLAERTTAMIAMMTTSAYFELVNGLIVLDLNNDAHTTSGPDCPRHAWALFHCILARLPIFHLHCGRDKNPKPAMTVLCKPSNEMLL